MLESDIFRMGGARFVLNMLSRYGRAWTALLAALGCASLCAGIFIDLRWGIVFLMLLFIVSPLVFVFLYIYYGLRPVNAVNVARHRVSVGESCLRTDIFGRRNEQEDEGGEEVLSSLEVPMSGVSGYVVGYDSVIVAIDSPHRGFLWLPVSAFRDMDAFGEAVGVIRRGISRNRDGIRSYV